MSVKANAVKVNGKSYRYNMVKAAGIILMPVGIIVAVMSLLLLSIVPVAGMVLFSAGLVFIYVSTVYIKGLSTGECNIEIKKILAIVVFALIVVAGLWYCGFNFLRAM
ncbi:MAG: hypothetical protein ACI4D0_02200 [Lachnospira sp.]